MPMKGVFINCILVLASSALALSAIEVALRVFDKPAWDDEVRVGWKSTHDWRDHDWRENNQLGYRGKPIHYSTRDIVVVLLGNSQVQSNACPPDKMPERYLEQYLRERDARFSVFTVGSAGYGNDQEYLALREYFVKYRADAVVLWQTFANDVWNNIFPTNWPEDGTIKPTYWLDHGTLKGPNYRQGEVIRKPARTKIGVLLNRAFAPAKRDG